ncbi:histone deacetylase [Alsobacter soli]|uniref:Histone deacetylase n=1 Tax=Alsobacter soli TaxID=2109933 RepID=A0A2T1HM60_9HYPH|nr:histone deacetylase [Alsobacter soli]PSC02745.1 histone deacetylase [Alsobacter soli]
MLPVVYHPAYSAEIPSDHRFPMGKYRRLAEILVEDGVVAPGDFIEPEPASFALLSRVHDPGYVRQVFDGAVPRAVEREIGLPMNRSVAERARAATGGTLLAARLALRHGLACNTAGGSHHAGPLHGAGFCTFNDVAAAARLLLDEGAVDRILVVDLDVHQGDGTARIFADEARVFTFSMHGEKNYPVRRAVSDLDIDLPDGMEDGAYLARLAEVLPGLVDRTRPDLVFYNAGVDPHRDDRLGRLSLTDDGLAARDAFVLKTCLAKGRPVAGVIGGGYERDVERVARRHSILHRTAAGFVGRRRSL